MRKIVTTFILTAFLANLCVPSACAQALLPKPGDMIPLSLPFDPPVLAGIKVYANDPLRFDFILDQGQETYPDPGSGQVAQRLIKYFLASLTVPEKDLWVNLSPYEKDRIITAEFGLTEMGRDLLAQDYILKQITSSLMYPEEGLGKIFWDKVYVKAQEKFGTTDIPIDTFNKVWITSSKAVVYEKIQGDGSAVAYVLESPLKVMLEKDYLATKNNVGPSTVESSIAQDVIREVILPVLEKEVNEGKNFAQLRQVYHSFILAAWYKKKIKASLLSAVYVDQKKVQGVNIDDPRETERIWGQYVEAFKKGVFDYITEERDTLSDELLPRKYFSGGARFTDQVVTVNGLNVAGLPKSNQTLILSGIKGVSMDASQDEAPAVGSTQKSPMTPLTVFPGRLRNVFEFIFSDAFARKTGINFKDGKKNVMDIGPGFRAYSMGEFRQIVDGKKLAMEISSVELPDAVATTEMSFQKGKVFEDFKRMIEPHLKSKGDMHSRIDQCERSSRAGDPGIWSCAAA